MPWCCRKFGFAAGHRVLKHESKCRHAHGHEYLAEVTVFAPELDPLGRVVDFGVMKTLVGDWIDQNWDHNFICHPEDPLISLLSDPAIGGGKKPYVLGVNPTAENLVEHLTIQLDKIFIAHGQGLRCAHVKLWETPNCWVEYHHPDFSCVVVGDPNFTPNPKI